MPKQRNDTDVPAGDDLADGGNGAADEAGVGGRDIVADVGAVAYTEDQRLKFLIASSLETRRAFIVKTELAVYFGYAGTEHQFRKALCNLVFPEVHRVTRQEMQALMADELKTMGAE